MKRLHFADFKLAGLTYYDAPLVFDKLEIGTELRMVRDLENRYDPEAVAIYFEDNKLGFVPSSENSELAKLCEQGYSNIFEVRINRISPETHPESQIGVAVHLLQKE